MAAETITQNPHLDVIPDHAGPHYDDIRTILVNTGITNEQAIKTLNVSWTRSHEERIQAWDQQVIKDEAALKEERQEQEDQLRAERKQELKNERREIERKKSKMNDFNEDAMVSDFLTPRPYDYALRRIADFDYVELWYFTQEGCAHAMDQPTQNEDTLCLTRVDDLVFFKPMSALRASEDVIQDAELSWRQMEIAKTNLIQHITRCGWSEKAITALAQFFMNLGVHHYRQRPHGEQALLSYQAQVRRDWHDQLKLGNGFNIAIINETLLQSIHRRIMDREFLDEVSHHTFLIRSLNSSLHSLSPFITPPSPALLRVPPRYAYTPCTARLPITPDACPRGNSISKPCTNQ
jgi:actin-related protein